MKVGDLVMWIGKDSDHGMIGVIVKAHTTQRFDVLWSDDAFGKEIHYLSLMALDDVPER
jgi:hypothetical protein